MVELEFGDTEPLPKVLQKEWIEKIRDMRVIRANFIVDGYETERLLDELLLEILYPGIQEQKPHALRDRLNALKNELGHDLLQEIQLATKIRILSNLQDRTPELKANVKKGLRDRLDAVRRIRNRFAHNPINFRVQGKPPKHKWIATLRCPGADFQLTSPLIFKWSQQQVDVRSELVELLKTLRQRKWA